MQKKLTSHERGSNSCRRTTNHTNIQVELCCWLQTYSDWVDKTRWIWRLLIVRGLVIRELGIRFRGAVWTLTGITPLQVEQNERNVDPADTQSRFYMSRNAPRVYMYRNAACIAHTCSIYMRVSIYSMCSRDCAVAFAKYIFRVGIRRSSYIAYLSIYGKIEQSKRVKGCCALRRKTRCANGGRNVATGDGWDMLKVGQ